MRVPAVIAFVPLFAGAVAASAGSELVMIERDGCGWCMRWDRQIAPAYPKTAEGRLAPLRRLDIGAPVPADLTFASPPVYTPTFVLVVDGREVGRLEGYASEDFFWFLLDGMLTRAGLDPAEQDR